MNPDVRRLRRLLKQTAELLNIYGLATLEAENKLGYKLVRSERGDEMLSLHMKLHQEFKRKRKP